MKRKVSGYRTVQVSYEGGEFRNGIGGKEIWMKKINVKPHVMGKEKKNGQKY